MLHSTKTKPAKIWNPPWPCWHVFFEFPWRLLAICRICIVSFFVIKSKFGSSYKKRKIRQKVEAVMGSVESVCLEQGEILRDVVAQSCLFRRKKTFNGINGKEVIWHVFSEVANEPGVRKAFCELVPEELWNQRIQMMSVPDWMLLLCKLESTIYDDSWQMILNRTRLGKSGVS